MPQRGLEVRMAFVLSTTVTACRIKLIRSTLSPFYKSVVDEIEERDQVVAMDASMPLRELI